MFIAPGSNYADFKNLVAALRHVDAVFYFQPAEGVSFVIQAFLDGGSVVAECDTGTKPSTFDADFPHAIAMTGESPFNTQG